MGWRGGKPPAKVASLDTIDLLKQSFLTRLSSTQPIILSTDVSMVSSPSAVLIIGCMIDAEEGQSGKIRFLFAAIRISCSLCR
jgi:hypothetical protein